MSILARVEDSAAPDPAQMVGTLLCLGVALAASVLVAWGLGVFHRRSIHGPPRMLPQEPAWPLVVIMMAGFAGWLLVPMTYQAYLQFIERAGQQAIETPSPPAPADPSAGFEPMLVGIGGFIFGFIVLVIANLLYRPGGLSRLGFGLPALPSGLLRGLIGGAIIMAPMLVLALGLTVFWRALGVDQLVHPALEILDEHRKDRAFVALTLFAVVIVASFFEELLFRGHLQTLLRRGTGSPWAAVLIASVPFAVMHPWWSWPAIFILSIFIGYAYERTGNLWVPITMHGIFNGVQTLLFLLTPWLERLAEEQANAAFCWLE